MNSKIKFTLFALPLVAVTLLLLSSSTRSKWMDGDPYSKGRSNMVEMYFQEIVNKSAPLAALETELREVNQRQDKLEDEFTDYDNVSKEYYRDANAIVNAITDSSLKRKMLGLMTESNEKYQTKTTDIRNSLKEFTRNDVVMADYHRVLKLVTTLAFIGKYQVDKKPEPQKYRDLSKDQLTMIEKIKAQTPKY